MKERALPWPSVATQTLVPKPPHERLRSLTIHLYPPLFGGPGRLVMGTDRRAFEKDHAESLIPVFDLFKEALLYSVLRPANEQLCAIHQGPNSDGRARLFAPF
ncbi:hypothetical protein EDC15_12232 [Acetobacter aceti NBRC 14818]|nr:hypothetical protein EDC15_12232 [Acetobacter aceti NBRC 14818]